MDNSMKNQVVVITGASSGIGRATAQAFSRRGASIVLAARRQAMLDEAAQECCELGGRPLVVPTDVTVEAEVERLAERTLERFRRIDVWFNNAGVGVFGRFNDIPTRAWHRVMETNVLGCMHGAKAAMRQFREQGHGVLINNASVVGRLAKPDSTAYAASKFAVRGFSEALRQELLDQPDIKVCTLLPSVIDTPFFHHAANFSYLRVRAAPPVYSADKVAETVVALVHRPRAEVVVGGFGRVASALKTLLPAPMTRLNARLLHRGFLAREPRPVTHGSLFEPMDDGLAVEGGWRNGWNNGGVPLAVAVGAVAALLLGRAVLLRRGLRAD